MPEDVNLSKETIRTFLISEHRLFAEALMVALEESPGLAVIGHANTREVAGTLTGMKSVDFHVLLLEAASDCASTLLTAREIKTALPSVKLLILGLEPSEESVLGFINGGVNGFLSEHCSLEQLIGAIEAVHRNEMSYSTDLITLAVSRLRKLSEQCDQPLMLSAREKEILQLMAHHLANKEIANRLGITTSTAKSHVHNILQKLKVTRRREAIRKARLANIVTEKFQLSSTAKVAPHSTRLTGDGKLPRIGWKT
jgi:DNA-binding NarL/FixJ family response regulator